MRARPRFSRLLSAYSADVVGREDIVEREAAARWPRAVLRRNLGRGVERLVGIGPQALAEHPLAVPFAVGRGGVEEVAAEVDRELERAGATRRRRSRSSRRGPTSRSRSR